MRSERALRAAAVERTAARVTPELAAAFLAELGESGIELGVDQAAAVRGVLTSGAERRVPRRPCRAPARASWSARSRTPGLTRPCGAASSAACSGSPRSQIASTVLHDEGVTARNIAQWRAVQQRLAEGRAFGDDEDWRLDAG